MNKVSVQSLNEYFNVSGEDFICIDDSDYEQPKICQPWNKGKLGLYKHTEETKKLITGRPKGFKHTKKWKEDKSISMCGENNPFYGKKHSNATMKKITQRYRKHYRFISPSGEIFEGHTTIREFCRKKSMCPKTIRNKWIIQEIE